MSRVRMWITVIFLLVSVFCLGSFLADSDECLADEISHIVISEVQISGEGANDEFVELYNPTDSEVNLENWTLKRKTKSGSENNILYKIEGVIPAGGYFLIVPRENCGGDKNEDCYKGSIGSDDEYTTNSFLAKDNAILLYDNYNGDKNLVDKVGWGKASDFEGKAVENNPEAKQSLERKTINGIIQDTDNNKNDFEIQETPNPQNSTIIETGDSSDTGGKEDKEKIGNEDNNGNNNEDGNNEDLNNDNATAGGSGEPTPNPYQEEDNNNNFDIIITELVPNPEDDDRENEFIEIYNQGNIAANISGWTMEDKLGKTKQFIFPESTTLSPKEYRVFYRPETKITLNNSGDGVILKNSSGKIISETPASGAALEDWSWSRGENDNWAWSLTPTAGKENVFEREEKSPLTPPSQGGKKKGYPLISHLQGAEKEKSFDFSDEIIINEIFPNPEGQDNQNKNYEWIELYNSSDRKINLYGWQIDDIINGGSKPYFIEDDLEISARSYLTMDYSRTKIVLNNDGDEINLLDPDGKIISRVVYKKGGKKGWSWSRNKDGEWEWNPTPTPGTENVFEGGDQGDEGDDGNKEEETGNRKLETERGNSKDNPIEISISEAKKLARYSWVKVQGIVSAPPGVFGEKTIYLSGSGIQVYSYQENLPNFKIGDLVEVIGRISEIGGEKRILLSQADDLKIISHQKEPEPIIVLTGDVGEPIEGYLVTVEGKVTETSGSVFYLDDGSGEVKIYIKPSTGIKKPSVKKGDWMVVTGQVSRTSTSYRILPRFQNDVRLGRVSGISASLTEAGSNLLMVVLILIGAAVLIDWGKLRIKRLTN